MRKRGVVLLCLLCGFFAQPLSASEHPVTTVKSVNLKRYLGAWYEIASFPNRFQRDCQCTSAHYDVEGRHIGILNRCYKGHSLVLDEARGKAWPVDETNSKLKVQFFWPFTGNYWILALSPSYRWVLVGSPNREYLWVLSRSRVMSQKRYRAIVRLAKQQGFDVTRLVKTFQRCRQPRQHK